MTSLLKPVFRQRWLWQKGQFLDHCHHYYAKGSTPRAASSSSSSSKLAGDPSKLVSGLTQEQVDVNPEIAEYLRANFAAGGDSSDGTISSGITVPIEILKEFGVDEDDLALGEDDAKKSYGDPRVDAGLGDEEQQRLNIRVLRSYVRTQDGTRPCDRLRNYHHMIPGILYGGDPTAGITSMDQSSKTLLKTSWSELQRELDRFHRRFESRVYDLAVYEDENDTVGTVHRVVPRNVQRHPVEGKIYCANFLRYHAGRPLKIPLVYINQEESPALKRDGYIIPVNKHVECLVEDGVPIPDALEVECTGLLVKDVIRMDRVIFPEGVRPTHRVDQENFVVGPVRGGRSSALEDDSGDAGDAAKEE